MFWCALDVLGFRVGCIFFIPRIQSANGCQWLPMPYHVIVPNTLGQLFSVTSPYLNLNLKYFVSFVDTHPSDTTTINLFTVAIISMDC